jgi:homoserine acetyltransferase
MEEPVHLFKSPNFPLDCGTTLPELVVGYQTYGARHDDEGTKRRVALVSTCFGEMVWFEIIRYTRVTEALVSFVGRATLSSAPAKHSIRTSTTSSAPTSWEGRTYVSC